MTAKAKKKAKTPRKSAVARVDPVLAEHKLMKVVAFYTKDVKPYWNNPRNNTESAVEYVAASIKAIGWRQPIVVDKELVVIAGHTRLLAAQLLELEVVPVHIADDLTDDQVRAYRVMDNRAAQHSTWEWANLSVESKEMELAFPDALYAITFDTGLLNEMKVMLAEGFPPLGDPDGPGDAHRDPLAFTIIIGDPDFKDSAIEAVRMLMESNPSWCATFK